MKHQQPTLEAGGKRVLVDCGLFQGYKRSRERNRAPFPVPPYSIDAVILTHAHLDHTGYVPALVRDGFGGPVYAPEGTTDLCKLLLPDSGHLQEEEARYATQSGFSRYSQALPLYTAAEAVQSLNSFKARNFDSPLGLDAMEVTFLPAGHSLGASQVRVRIGPRSDKEPRMTYIIHGEPEASEALRVRIKRQLGWRARVPEHLGKISLEDPR